MGVNFKDIKKWAKNDTYDVATEFNRIENHNKYNEKWLKYCGLIPLSNNLSHKTDWNINIIPDINDYNRIKNNINILLSSYNSDLRLSINKTGINQVFSYVQANEIENAISETKKVVGNEQFRYNICGLSICGNNQRIIGVGVK